MALIYVTSFDILRVRDPGLLVEREVEHIQIFRRNSGPSNLETVTNTVMKAF